MTSTTNQLPSSVHPTYTSTTARTSIAKWSPITQALLPEWLCHSQQLRSSIPPSTTGGTGAGAYLAMARGSQPALPRWTLAAQSPLSAQQEMYVDGLLSVAFAFMELDPRVFEFPSIPEPGVIRQRWQYPPPPRHPPPPLPLPLFGCASTHPFGSGRSRISYPPLIPPPPRTQQQLARFLMGATDSLMRRFWTWGEG